MRTRRSALTARVALSLLGMAAWPGLSRPAQPAQPAQPAEVAPLADDATAEASAAMHLKQGIEHRRRGELGPAEDELTLAIGAYPAAALLYSERGQVRYLRRNYNGAAEDFSFYLAQTPSDAKILLLRSQARRFSNPEDKAGACADFAALRRLDASLSHIEGMDRYCR